jgi:nucleotide-binding universal stress UspA family protein
MTGNLVGQPIVVGVDGSDSARNAALWAADEAAARHLPLRLVHAVVTSPMAYTGGPAIPQSYFDAIGNDGRRRLIEVEKAIRHLHPKLTIEADLRMADPVPMLLAESDNARLVVLGSRGLGGFAGIVVGSTAIALVAHAHCPVAVIRERAAGDTGRTGGPVVVGVDGSPASESALAMAFDEASVRGADLVAVHTWIEFPSDQAFAYAQQFINNWGVLETREQEVLAERLAGWQEKYPDVTVRRVVTRDPPVRGLLDQAAHAQLLVVGSRGHGGILGMALGSTSQALIYHATCPLLIARPNGTE